MKLDNKIIILAMLVMMIACISAVSATDIESADDAIVTDDVAVDEVSDVVEEAEIDNVDLGAVNEVETDDAQEDIVEEQQENPVTTGTINGQPWENFVFNTTGYLKTSNDLTFSGDFYAQTFGNFKVDKSITINAANATFHNIGFDLPSSQITINGGTFIFDENTAVNSVIYDFGSENTIQNTVMNITAPENNDFWAINLNQPNGALVFNNTIYYECNYANNESSISSAKNKSPIPSSISTSPCSCIERPSSIKEFPDSIRAFPSFTDSLPACPLAFPSAIIF